MDKTAPLLKKGDIIGEIYEVIRLIGQSAVDDAYLVRNTVTGKRYTLKRLLSEFTSMPDYESIFENNRHRISDFIHPNIIGHHKIACAEDEYYIVSSYVSAIGGKPRTLKDRISRQGKMHEFQAKNIFLQICGGLHHSISSPKNPPPHFDLKPSNILFDSSHMVRISDFNKKRLVPDTHVRRLIAKAKLDRDQFLQYGIPHRYMPTYDRNGDPNENTSVINMEEYSVIGVEDTSHRKHTIKNLKKDIDVNYINQFNSDSIRDRSLKSLVESFEFMSPEQKNGSEPDERSNIYSLGLILYYILTGQKLDRDNYVPPSKLECNSFWDVIVRKCTDPNPEKRYQSISRLQHEVIQGKASKTHLVSLLTYVAIMTVLGGGIYMTVQRAIAPDNAQQSEHLNRAIRESGIDVSNKLSVIELSADPHGASVEIIQNGVTIKKIDSIPTAGVKYILQPGKYQVEAFKPGYKILQREINFTPGNLQIALRLNQSDTLEVKQYVYKKDLAKPEAGYPYTIPSVKLEILPLDRGNFKMGSNEPENARGVHDKPESHAVIDQHFWLGKTEVTQRAYEEIMFTNPSVHTSGTGLRPVDRVTWQLANEFCRKLNEREKASGRLPDGYEYRLPTEKEWEYACRAGTITTYNFGNNPKLMVDYAWFNGNSFYETHEVATRMPNRWGFYDMHGNVAEWAVNSYPEGSDANSFILRGGSWKDLPSHLHSSSRLRIDSQNYADSNTGIRIALAPVIKSTP